jgi:ATP-binding cassette subfamily F protein 3
MLGSFLFRGDDIHKSLNVLSGGEKSRLALLRLLLRPLNLLILDEPTNHLDLASKDVLLESLRDFGGTIIFVSHDRGFIEGLSTRVLELTADPAGGPSRVRNFPGDYAYYHERVERETAGENASIPQGEPSSQARAGKAALEQAGAQGSFAQSREAEKRKKADRRRLEREEERLLAEIDQVECRKREREQLLATPEVYSDGIKSRDVQAEITRLDACIESLSRQWETVSTELEAIE